MKWSSGVILGLGLVCCVTSLSAVRKPSKDRFKTKPGMLPLYQAADQEMVRGLMKIRPGKSTLYNVKHQMPKPAVTLNQGAYLLWGWRLHSLPGSKYYDVIVTFHQDIVIQVERPILDPDFNSKIMRRRYGQPARTELRPKTDELPARTLFYYPKIKKTFIQDNKKKKLTSLIWYKD